MQQDFTEVSSLMNCSLILEEYIRNNKDVQVPTYIAFFDVKSVFDVVSHTSLLLKYTTQERIVLSGILLAVSILTQELLSRGKDSC